MDKKTSQFFVCAAYMRYRNSRENYNRIKEKDYPDSIQWEAWSVMTENWNNLQLYKTYYYGNLNRVNTENKVKL